MRKYAETILVVALTFVTTLVLQTLINYVWRSHGAVTIGSRISTPASGSRPVQIANQRDEPLNGIILTIPQTTRTTEIAASLPLQLADAADTTGTSDLRRIIISGVPPHRVVTLLIPVTRQADELRVINPEQLGLDVATGDEVPNPLRTILWRALIFAVFNTLVFGVATFYTIQSREAADAKQTAERTETDKRFKTVQDQIIEESRQYREEADRRTAELKGEIAALQKQTQRTGLLLLARISDYARELDFWRDAVRRALARGRDVSGADALIQQVTETLGTYRVRLSKQPDLETIKAMAGIMQQGERTLRALNKGHKQQQHVDSSPSESDQLKPPS